jgi:hypothetical protein
VAVGRARALLGLVRRTDVREVTPERELGEVCAERRLGGARCGDCVSLLPLAHNDDTTESLENKRNNSPSTRRNMHAAAQNRRRRTSERLSGASCQPWRGMMSLLSCAAPPPTPTPANAATARELSRSALTPARKMEDGMTAAARAGSRIAPASGVCRGVVEVGGGRC